MAEALGVPEGGHGAGFLQQSLGDPFGKVGTRTESIVASGIAST